MDDTKIEEGFKICSKCGEVKPISEFYKRKSSKDGLRSECKACSIARVSEYNAIHNEEKKAYKSEYYQANKEKKAAYNAAYYQANKDKISEYHAEYNNPHKSPLGWAKMMVNGYRKMDRERGFDTSQTISAEWFLQNIAYRPCVHCGVQAIGKVGCNRLDNTKGHTQDNVESCCFKCNCKENIRDQLERGIHMSCKHKNQSFSSFVEEHKAKRKNLT